MKVNEIKDVHLLQSLLKQAIKEIQDFGKDDDVYLVNNTYLCETEEEIVNYLLKYVEKGGRE